MTQDSTSLIKKNTALVDTGNGGSIKSQTANSKEEFDWYRMTQLFDNSKQPAGDTKVYPSTIVYEGGKGSKEQSSTATDSTWFKNALSYLNSTVDSLNNKIATMEKNKQSETKGVGLIMVIIIVVCGLVVFALLNGYLKKFSIVKKVL